MNARAWIWGAVGLVGLVAVGYGIHRTTRVSSRGLGETTRAQRASAKAVTRDARKALRSLEARTERIKMSLTELGNEAEAAHRAVALQRDALLDGDALNDDEDDDVVELRDVLNEVVAPDRDDVRGVFEALDADWDDRLKTFRASLDDVDALTG